MIEIGIFDGDYVVARTQATAENGDVVVAGIPGGEATIKTFLNRRNKIVLRPANEDFADIVLDAGDVQIYGKVVTLMRKF
jgi:repressor LexA